jgi:hypothetical protein
LGPILFLIYINDLYAASSLLKFMFADDTACTASGSNLDNLIISVNGEIKKLARWFRANKMAVNVSKTKFLLFHTKGKRIDNDIELTYDDNEPNNADPNLIHTIERFHSGHPNPNCRAYKILGVYIDEQLTFDYQTNNIISKLNRSLYCINKVKHLLPPPALRSLYFALFHSHLSYCPIIASCATNQNINKITLLQKKAIRIITNSTYHEHTAPIFKKLQILTYPKLIQYSKLNFMHSYIYNYCPNSFTNTWTLNTERENIPDLRNANLLSIPHPRIELFKKSPLYSLPVLWNSLNDTKLQHCKTTFRISLKEKLNNETE